MKHLNHITILGAAVLTLLSSTPASARSMASGAVNPEPLRFIHRRPVPAAGLHAVPGQRRASLPPARLSTQGRPELVANSISTHPGYGMYSFFAEPDAALTKVADIPPFFGGAVYANGKYYGADYDYLDYGNLAYVRWYVYDPLTWHCERMVENPLDYTYIATDRTFDPTTSTVYSIVYDRSASYINLATTSLADGSSAIINPLEKDVITIAADASGQLYGIDTEANLYKINKSNAALTLIGNTHIYDDYISEYTQTITFDHSTGKLYWAEFHTEGLFTSVAALYEVNPVTAVAVKISDLSDNPELAGLYVNDYIQPGVPGAATSLTATPAATGSLDYTFTCKAPTLTADGATLSGQVRLTLSVDDEPVYQTSCTPGQNVTYSQTMVRGLHTLKASVSNAIGQGVGSARMFFAGWDVPAAPTQVRLVNDNDVARLTWVAPQGGAEGGATRTPLTYTITRMPDNTVVATGVSGTSWSEQITSPAAYSYLVAAVSPEGTGPAAESNQAIMGSFAIPYDCSFDSQADFDLYTVVDINSHGKVWNYDSDNQRLRHPWSLDYEIDDYILTPPLKMVAGTAYQITFEAYQMVPSYQEHVMLYFGESTDIEDMTLLLDTYQLGEDPEEFRAVVAPPTTGTYHFAFRSKTGKNGFMSYVDNVSVTGNGTSTVPATPADFTARPADGGATEVTLSLTAPATTLGGQPLTGLERVDIMRGASSTPVKTFTAPAPGEALQWTDTDLRTGTYYYRAVAYSAAGASEAAEASAFVGVDIPLEPTDFDATGSEGTRRLSWTAPAEGLRGGNLNGLLTYRLERVVNEEPQTIAEGLTETTYTDTWTTETQAFVYYTVTAVTSAGSSATVSSRSFPVGKPYDIPYAESFAEAKTSTNPWSVEQVGGENGSWTVVTQGEEPFARAQDNDGGLVSFDGYHSWANGCILRLISPSINISTYEDPELTFYIYHYNGKAGWWQEDADPVNETLQVEISVDGGKFTTLDNSMIRLYNESSGWKKYAIPLDEYRVSPSIRVAFRGTGAGCFNIHLDNIGIGGTIPAIAVSEYGMIMPQVAGAKGCVRFFNLTAPLSVSDMEGRTVATSSLPNGEIALAPGIYVATSGGNAFKIVVK